MPDPAAKEPNTTHIIGCRTREEVTKIIADYQILGYTTTHIGPTSDVHVESGGESKHWLLEDEKDWYVVIATKDIITPPAKKGDP